MQANGKSIKQTSHQANSIKRIKRTIERCMQANMKTSKTSNKPLGAPRNRVGGDEQGRTKFATAFFNF